MTAATITGRRLVEGLEDEEGGDRGAPEPRRRRPHRAAARPAPRDHHRARPGDRPDAQRRARHAAGDLRRPRPGRRVARVGGPGPAAHPARAARRRALQRAHHRAAAARGRRRARRARGDPPLRPKTSSSVGVPGEPMSGGDAFKAFESGAWHDRASTYDLVIGAVTARVGEELLDAVGAGPGTRLLDVGCGPGTITAAARGQGRGCGGRRPRGGDARARPGAPPAPRAARGRRGGAAVPRRRASTRSSAGSSSTTSRPWRSALAEASEGPGGRAGASPSRCGTGRSATGCSAS